MALGIDFDASWFFFFFPSYFLMWFFSCLLPSWVDSISTQFRNCLNSVQLVWNFKLLIILLEIYTCQMRKYTNRTQQFCKCIYCMYTLAIDMTYMRRLSFSVRNFFFYLIFFLLPFCSSFIAIYKIANPPFAKHTKSILHSECITC